jgi:small Trp-rich protein
MYFVVLGVILLILKLADFGAVGLWSWWVILAPFGLAIVWWAWADASGWTKRREMDKMDERRQDRRLKNLDALGMDAKGRRGKSGSAKHARNHHL